MNPPLFHSTSAAESDDRDAVDYSDGHLHARPHALSAVPPPAAAGEHRLAVVGGAAATLYVPTSVARATSPLPLVVALHGAGAHAGQCISLLRSLAEAQRFLVLAPSSRATTWDLMADTVGPDVAALDDALAQVFARARVDAGRLVIGGFSDGASYAVSLGLANGDLFSTVVAFSPGFASPPSLAGRPKVFVSHGTKDAVLPIDSCSRRLVPRLRRAGYDIRYDEFDGEHEVPSAVAHAALAWALQSAH